MLSIEPLETRTLFSTYYVATSGANGGSGSSANPWKTLQYAADRVVAGDMVIVSAGNYAGFNLETSGTANARITFKAQSGVVINQINGVTKDGINLENCSYVTIDGFTLIGTGNPSTSRAGIRVVGDGYGFDDGQFSKNVIIEYNNCDQWGQWGILTGFCDDMIIQNNVASRSAQQHGIYFGNSGDRPIIRNNVCWGNANCGIHMNADIDTGDTSIPAVDGIITGALVDGNTCYDNGGGGAFGAGGGSAINCDGVQNSRIVNNVLYDNHAGGISLYQTDAAGPASGDTVANNAVIQASDGRWCLLVTNGAVNTTVFNNIFYNLQGYRGSIEFTDDSAAGFKSDYNITDGKFSTDDSAISFASWKSSTGGDAHSIALSLAQMQSLFAGYSANNFALSESSTAMGFGVASLNSKLAPTIDHIGAVRNGPLDAGAYQHASQSLDPDFAMLSNGKLTIEGTAGADAISVNRVGSQFIVMLNGAQRSFASSDVTSIDVYANDGNDIVMIGQSVIGTYVNAGSGNDVVHGSDSADTISGGAGKDQLYGGAGDDLLSGNQAPDSLYGESGKDRLYGGDGDDHLEGGTHADRLYGDAGHNYLDGGAGDDRLYALNQSTDTIIGGAGVDWAQTDKFESMMLYIESAAA